MACHESTTNFQFSTLLFFALAKNNKAHTRKPEREASKDDKNFAQMAHKRVFQILKTNPTRLALVFLLLDFNELFHPTPKKKTVDVESKELLAAETHIQHTAADQNCVIKITITTSGPWKRVKKK